MQRELLFSMAGHNFIKYWALSVAFFMATSFAATAQESKISLRDIQNLHLYGAKMALVGERKTKPVPSADNISPRDFHNVEILDLSNIDVFELPKWFAKLKSLRKLLLRNSKLEFASLQTIAQLDQLEVLDVSGNPEISIGIVEPSANLISALSSLTNLRELNISGAGLGTSQVGDISTLSNLVILDISQNKISSLQPLKLSSIRGLQHLNISSNEITNIAAAELPNLWLTYLDLSKNKLAKLIYMDMPELKFFDISGNPDLTLNPKYGSIFGLPSLETFKIDLSETVPDSIICRLKKLDGNDCNKNTNGHGMSALEPDMVSVSNFEIGKFEVTLGEWQQCRNDGVCKHVDYGKSPPSVPITGIGKYIEWINANTGKKYRLPTLSEMELAIDRKNNGYAPLNDFAWTSYNTAKTGTRTHQFKPVGMKKPNSHGIYDIVGNTMELAYSGKSCGKENDTSDNPKNYNFLIGKLIKGDHPCYFILGGSIHGDTKNINDTYYLQLDDYFTLKIKNTDKIIIQTFERTSPAELFNEIFHLHPFGFRLVLGSI